MSALTARLAAVRSTAVKRPIPAVTAAIAAIVILLLIIGAVQGGAEPSSALGVTFGILAALSLVAVMAYSARRSVPAVRSLGNTRHYLQVHLWGGGLFVLLFLAHTSLRPPAGVMPALLWLLSLWVVVTGVIGLLLQRAVPRVLETTSSLEVNLERIPTFVDELRTRAEMIAAQADPRVKAYYQQQYAADMTAPRMLGAQLFRDPRMPARGSREVDIMKGTLAAEGLVSLEAIRDLRATKHELDVHFTLQRILRGWLYLHLPVAVVLLGVVALHVFFILYF